MAVQNLTDALIRLMKNVRIHLPGALDDVIILELFNVLNDFCHETNVWQEDIDFDTVADQTEYSIYESEPASIIRLMRVENEDDATVSATMQTPGILILTTEPSQVETLTATVALTVVDPSDANDYPRMPDWLLQRHYQAIVHGVLARMMAQPVKPYSNERLGVFYSRKYSSATAAARAAVLHQNVLGGQRWRFPQNFAPGSQRR